MIRVSPARLGGPSKVSRPVQRHTPCGSDLGAALVAIENEATCVAETVAQDRPTRETVLSMQNLRRDIRLFEFEIILRHLCELRASSADGPFYEEIGQLATLLHEARRLAWKGEAPCSD
jgi:hypothetical protein